MSFMGGAECSSAGNPLSQFSKHVQGDSSLQQDRLMNMGPANGAAAFRSMPDQSAAHDEMLNQALHNPDPMMAPMPSGLHLEAMHMRASSASPSWGPEFHAATPPALQAPQGPGFSAAEFAKFQSMQPSAASASATEAARASPGPNGAQLHRPMMGGMMGMSPMTMGMAPMGMMGMHHRPLYQPQQYQNPMFQQDSSMDKGKGKAIELDDHKWEEQFAQMELADKAAQEKVDEDAAKAMEPELDKLDEELAKESGETNYGDFESIWRGIQAENEAVTGSADFSFDDRWNTADVDANWDTFNGPSNGSMLNNFRVPTVEEYMFEQDNLFKSHGDPFAEGMRIIEGGGNLSLAALAFEAACQKDPNHVAAWTHLGMAQAQNEKEIAAIRALEQALKLDPNNLAALMSLAVSYTNEGYETTAYRTLERWLSVKYPSVISPADLTPIADMGFTDRHELHSKVTDLYIRAAQLSPGGTQHMDPDVQVGLGVLFYGAEEYDKAVDCFSAALASSEQGIVNESSQIHLLWNRLGATLANSGRSEEAIAAYEKALSINPNFVRARYNLGVSCINIGCHAEAAGHLLASLAMHKSVEKEGREKAMEILRDANGGGPVNEAELDKMTTQNRSTTLYDTLRRVFTQMGRRDLAERVVAGMDPEAFRGEFEF